MIPSATHPKPARASLEMLYQLIADDLAQVDKLILSRIESDVPLIATIAQHIIRSGGKRMRPALTLIAAQLCDAQAARAVPLAVAIEFIHTATLLHDDVVDESKLRRGLATANDLHGNKASVLVGDFLLSQAFQLMVENGSLKVLRILSDASAIIAKGEVLQLMTQGEPETSQEDYLRVIAAKTAELFASACELGAVAAERVELEAPLRAFGMAIGTAFQLVDDILDYAADQETLGKTVGDDFREGKVTLPVILAYRAGAADEKAFWQRTLGEHQQTPGDLATATALLHKHRALAQASELAAQYCDEARHALAGFPESAAKTAMLELADFCISRVY